MPDARSDVGRYYDRNTRRFLNLGHGGSRHAIRRAVWGPGISSRDDAIDYVNKLILAELTQSSAARVLDLGCGVGGSIHYLGGRHPATYVGATISRTQVEIGSIFLSEAGARNASIVEADFTSDEFARSFSPPADLAFAVESFIHVPRMCQRFGSIVRLVRPGGKLIVCDDMISRECAAESLRDTVSASRVRRWFREFGDGWHAAGLAEIDAVISGAAEAGLRLDEIRDLTPYLELDRRRDLAARFLMGLSRWSPVRPPWFANLLGGNALQLCLKNGLIRYMCAVFTRVR